MSRWVKSFSDKTSIRSDESMQMSWRHTKLEGMIAAHMSNSSHMGITVKGTGRYNYIEKHIATFSGDEVVSTILQYWPVSNQIYAMTEYDNSQWEFIDSHTCNPYGLRIHVPAGHYLEVELSSNRNVLDYRVKEGV